MQKICRKCLGDSFTLRSYESIQIWLLILNSLIRSFSVWMNWIFWIFWICVIQIFWEFWKWVLVDPQDWWATALRAVNPRADESWKSTKTHFQNREQFWRIRRIHFQNSQKIWIIQIQNIILNQAEKNVWIRVNLLKSNVQ